MDCEKLEAELTGQTQLKGISPCIINTQPIPTLFWFFATQLSSP